MAKMYIEQFESIPSGELTIDQKTILIKLQKALDSKYWFSFLKHRTIKKTNDLAEIILLNHTLKNLVKLHDNCLNCLFNPNNYNIVLSIEEKMLDIKTDLEFSCSVYKGEKYTIKYNSLCFVNSILNIIKTIKILQKNQMPSKINIQ